MFELAGAAAAFAVTVSHDGLSGGFPDLGLNVVARGTFERPQFVAGTFGFSSPKSRIFVLQLSQAGRTIEFECAVAG